MRQKLLPGLAALGLLIGAGCSTTSDISSDTTTTAPTANTISETAAEAAAAQAEAEAQAKAAAEAAAQQAAEREAQAAAEAARKAAEAKAKADRMMAEAKAAQERAAAEAAAKEAARKQAEAKAAAEAAKKAAEEKARAAAEAARKAAEAKAAKERAAAEAAAQEAARKQAEATRLAKEQAEKAAAAAAAEKAKQVAALTQPVVPKTTVATGSVSGKLAVTRKGKTLKESALIHLEPLSGQAVRSTSNATHIIKMKAKRFAPRFLVIQPGDTVVYENLDRIRHNVFSLSENNKFDLGTYGRGTRPERKFIAEGLVKVYCNIHPNMASFVRVTDSPWHTVSGPDGTFSIDNVPAGKYKLVAWNIRGEHTEEITVTGGQQLTLNSSIDSTRYKKKQHRNKFGKKYPRTIGNGESY